MIPPIPSEVSTIFRAATAAVPPGAGLPPGDAANDATRAISTTALVGAATVTVPPSPSEGTRRALVELLPAGTASVRGGAFVGDSTTSVLSGTSTVT